MWGHVRFGLDFIRDRRLPHAEVYSYTSDLPFTDHEWLGDVINGLSYAGGGAIGLILMKAVVVGTAYVLVIRAYRNLPWLVPELIAIAAAILCLPLTLAIRPQIWSFLFVALLCRVPLDGALSLFIPVMFALWANLHGGWIVGLALLGGRYAGACWRQPRVTTRAVAVLACSVLMTLANAYGIELWQFMVATLRLKRSDIIEWLPIWTGYPAQNLWSWFFAVAVAIACAPRVIRTRPEVIAILAGLAYTSQRVQRLVPLFVISTALLLAPSVSADPAPQRSVVARERSSIRSINWALLSLVVLLSLRSLGPRLSCIGPQPEQFQPDIAAAAVLRDMGAPGRLAVEFDWGEFAIWTFGPRIRVSLDGRREASYSDRVLAEQRELAAGSPDGLRVLDRDRPDYIWMRRSRTTLFDALRQRSYRIDVVTDRSFIAVRSDLPVLAGRIPPTTDACFPGL